MDKKQRDLSNFRLEKAKLENRKKFLAKVEKFLEMIAEHEEELE